MIRITRLSGEEIVINDDLIEFIETIPETMISLTDGKKIMVRESPDEIIQKVAAFRRMASSMEWSSELARQPKGKEQ